MQAENHLSRCQTRWPFHLSRGEIGQEIAPNREGNSEKTGSASNIG